MKEKEDFEQIRIETESGYKVRQYKKTKITEN